MQELASTVVKDDLQLELVVQAGFDDEGTHLLVTHVPLSPPLITSVTKLLPKCYIRGDHDWTCVGCQHSSDMVDLISHTDDCPVFKLQCEIQMMKGTPSETISLN